MARKSTPSIEKSHNGISADEFQNKLLNWFEDRGLLSDLQAHLRRQMIVALRDTSLNIHTTGSFHQAGSPKLQAINLLVAEFLLRQQYHYTLSVFTSEVPLLRNLPEFTSGATSSSIIPGSSADRFPGFQQRDVFDILEALGFPPNSPEGRTTYELYRNNEGEALLTCLIRSLPESSHKDEHQSSANKSDVNTDGKDKNSKERQTALKELASFSQDIQTLIENSPLQPEQIIHLQEAIVRLIETERKNVQEEEEAKFNKELVDREHRIQAEWERQEEDIRQKLQQAEENFQSERSKLEQDLKQKQIQLSELAAQLREQQNEVANRLNYVQERNNVLEKREMELRATKKKSEEHLQKKSKALENKEKQLEEEFARLEMENKEREKEKEELVHRARLVDEVSKTLMESQAEITFLRQMKDKYEAEIKKSKESQGPSTSSETQTTSKKKKKSNICNQAAQTAEIETIPVAKKQSSQQTAMISCESRSLQTQLRGSDMDEAVLELRKQCADNERQRSQHEMYGSLVEQLQQDNTELRGHNEQQRIRIQELTTQAAQLVSQLDDANTALALLGNRPTTPELDQHGVQTSPQPLTPVSSMPPSLPVMGTVPGLALGAVGFQVPPPAPPQPHVFPRSRPTNITARSRQVGAGEESYFLRHLTSEMTRHSTTPPPREQRRKPPRRLMVHSVSSSDESSPSPTEEMLREARRRLRRLEEETQAVDRSYQEFRIRHADSLAGSPSILFHPVLNDVGNHFRFPTPQSFLPRTSHAGGSHFVTFPSAYSRNRLFNTQSNLMSQLYPGVYQPYPLFSLTRANGQSRYPYLYTTNQSHHLQNISSVYSVPTQIFGMDNQSTSLGNTVTTTVHIPPIPTVHTNRIPNVNRANLRTDSRTQPSHNWGRTFSSESRQEEVQHLPSGNSALPCEVPRVFSVPQIPASSAHKPLQPTLDIPNHGPNVTSSSQPQRLPSPHFYKNVETSNSEKHEVVEGKKDTSYSYELPSTSNSKRLVQSSTGNVLLESQFTKQNENESFKASDVQNYNIGTQRTMDKTPQKQPQPSVSTNHSIKQDIQTTSVRKKKGSSKLKTSNESSPSTGNSVGSLDIDIIKEPVNIPSKDEVDLIPIIADFPLLQNTSTSIHESKDDLIEKPSTTCITEISMKEGSSEKKTQHTHDSISKKNSQPVIPLQDSACENEQNANNIEAADEKNKSGTESLKNKKTETTQQEHDEQGNYFIHSRESDQIIQTLNVVSQNAFGRSSSSDPSTLASNNDISSDIQISAGKGNSDDSW